MSIEWLVRVSEPHDLSVLMIADFGMSLEIRYDDDRYADVYFSS